MTNIIVKITWYQNQIPISTLYFIAIFRSHRNAEENCASMNVEFVNATTKVAVTSILNAYENEFILSYFGGDEVGRIAPDKMWIGMEVAADSEISWTDTYAFDFSNWGENEPKFNAATYSGVIQKDGSWTTTNSTSGKGII
jgi:hypothetical protein